MRTAFFATLFVAIFTIVGGSKYYSVKSDLMRSRKTIDDEWLHVVVALQQRADLLPRLVNRVEEADPQATGVETEAAEARAALAHATTRRETIAASGRLDTATSRLLLLSDSRPRRQPKRKFLPLEDELAEAENHFLLARRKYNESLEHYNVDIQRFPANVVAGIAGFTRNDDYFKTEPGSADIPKVQF